MGYAKVFLIPITLSGRVILTLVRVLLGVVLLADVSLKPTYRELQEFPVLQSGLTPMNTSLVYDPKFQFEATANFWWNFPSVMSSGFSIAPVTCSGNDCQSFWFPGPISSIQFAPGAAPVTDDDAPQATTFIEKSAPGYQIDFNPIDETKDPPMLLEDCRVFGIPIIAIQLCLKKTNDSSLLAGTVQIPFHKGNSRLDSLPQRRRKRNQLFKHNGMAPNDTYQYKDDSLKTARVDRLRSSELYYYRRK